MAIQTGSLDILRNGIAHRREDGTVVLVRPARNGGFATEVEVPQELADPHRLASGDVVEGDTEPIPLAAPPDEHPADLNDLDDYDERDEPAAARGETAPAWLVNRRCPAEKLVAVRRINGLPADEAADRPSPREKRSSYERVAPTERLAMAAGPDDATGRMLDFAAPLGVGYAGILYGPHGSGLTRCLQAALRGVRENGPPLVLFVLLARARGEEVTDWRRRFPEAEVVVCPAPQAGATAEETLRVADLTLECARRQTELGRHVAVAVDSLTGLWGAMLEAEEADAQVEADRAWSRRRVREWMEAAGDFRGKGLLGSGLGGSLTVLATVWRQGVDPEAEEEGEIHPHLRLMEHVVHEAAWRVPLSGELARARHFPAIDTARALSDREADLMPAARYERLLAARKALAPLDLVPRYLRLMDALDATDDEPALLERLAQA